MPINIPSNLYSGGRVTVDSTPFVNTVIKDMAAKKATKDALVKSTDALNKNLNYAGVRQQDLKDYTDETGKNYSGIENRATQWYNNAIKGGVDMTEYRNILNDIEKSKQRIKTHNDLTTAALDKKIDPTVDDIHVLSKVELPIQYPGSRKVDNSEYTLADMPAFIPELDEPKWDKSLFGNAQPTTIVKQVPIPGTDRYDLVRGFSKNEMANFAQTAAGLVNVDKSADKQFRAQLRDPNFVATRTEALQSVFGKDAIVNSPQTAAAGDAIIRANQKAKTESFSKPVDQFALARYRKSLGTGEIDDNYLNRINKRAYDASKESAYTTMNGKKYEGKIVDVPMEIRNKYGFEEKDAKGNTISVVPDAFMFTHDMKTVIPQFYEKDENGEPIKTSSGAKRIRRNINSKPLSMDNYKVDLGGILLGKKTYAREVADEEDNSSPTYSSESGIEMQSSKNTGLSGYDAATQAGIKAYMKDKSLSEAQAIKNLKTAKKIK
jgi:hypothetical protein